MAGSGKTEAAQTDADLTVRRAGPRDWQAILDIDATGGAYDEGDYLHGKLAAYLTDKNRFCYIGEIGGKVVCFYLLHPEDGGRNMVGRVARVDRNVRGLRVWHKTSHLAILDYVSHNPRTRRYYACTASYQRFNIAQHSFNVVMTRGMFSLYASRTINIDLPTGVAGNSLETLTFDHCNELLSDRLRNWLLFPHGIIVVGREPLHISPQNIHMIFEECKLILASKSASGETTILSFGTAFDSPQGHVWEVDIYTSSVDNATDVVGHVITHFKSALTCFPDAIIKLVVFMWPASRADDIRNRLKPLVDAGHVTLGRSADHTTFDCTIDVFLQYLTSKL